MKIKSILYVEDEDSVREQLSKFIQRFCEELYVAKDGKEGLEFYKQKSPNIVITDIKMPRMNGIDMIYAIKDINQDTPVIFTSAHSESNYFMEAIELQVEGYILKPIELKKLSSIINKIIDNQIMKLNFLLQQEILKNMAFKDCLTGISNRQMFDEDLAREIKRFNREKNPLSMIMFDIDKFKILNDTHGHQVGDHILVAITKLISNNIRGTDMFARWGGEEFMLLLPNTDIKSATSLASSLRQKVQDYDFYNSLSITASFGVTEVTKEESIKSFIKRVDDALYKAKESGRNKVVSS